jgi:hypothetical protein
MIAMTTKSSINVKPFGLVISQSPYLEKADIGQTDLASVAP